jgi:hypothetical protein
MSNIDEELAHLLEASPDREEVDVLVYAEDFDELEAFLSARADAGELRFNRLPLANTIVVRAPKGVIREIAARRDVSRMTLNPTFGIQTTGPEPPAT